jgi:phage major head subunit gpT-like protein
VWKELATVVPSSTKTNTYGWLGDFPHMREWVGDRVVKDIKESAYTLANQKYESTMGLNREDIEDDNIGQYRVLAQAEADEVARWRNRKIASLLEGGFTNLCFDGQPFFDDEHPVYPNADGTGTAVNTSNIIGTGEESNPPWFLLSLKGVLKPFIAQHRMGPEFDALTDPKTDSVFMKDRYLYGIHYRGNFGYSFWQLAIGSKTALTASNYEAARLAMRRFKRDGGDPMGITPTHLVVSPGNESAARAILEKEYLAGGESNSNYHTASLIVFDSLQDAAA